jgi:hypothetical protein
MRVHPIAHYIQGSDVRGTMHLIGRRAAAGARALNPTQSALGTAWDDEQDEALLHLTHLT